MYKRVETKNSKTSKEAQNKKNLNSHKIMVKYNENNNARDRKNSVDTMDDVNPLLFNENLERP